MMSMTLSFLKFRNPLDVMPSKGDHTDHDYIKNDFLRNNERANQMFEGEC